MYDVLISPERYTPRVEFYSNGKMLLEGRSMPENVFKLFQPLLHYAYNIECEKVDFDINMEYFNTATSKKILELLQALDTNAKVGQLNVIWHYESGDEDSVDMAEIYDECLSRTHFYLQEHEELVSLSNRVAYHKA